MRHNYAIGILLAALAFAGPAHVSAQNSAPGPWQNFLIPLGETVYDINNHVTWLAEANLPAEGVPGTLNFRFGLPLCNADSTGDCIWADGAMSYMTAQEWVRRLNAASYLGHFGFPARRSTILDAHPRGRRMKASASAAARAR